MTLDLLSMVCPPGIGCPLTAGLGLPEILLWVLTFAVAFGILTKLQIFGKSKAAPTLIAIVIGFFVLMAVPAALITALATMSTGLVVLAIGVVLFIALIEISGAKWYVGKDQDGRPVVGGSWYQGHGTAMAAILVILAAVVFWFSGGAALIGLGALPEIGAIPVVLIIVGLAVLWMLSGA